MADSAVPMQQVRAAFDEHTIVVYQAYSPAIAEPALATGRFVAPFKLDRMTWIKPSFLWMMYRCGWATKPGQERVLAVTITRNGFEWALANSCLSHHDPAVYSSEQAWTERKTASHVRIQSTPNGTCSSTHCHTAPSRSASAAKPPAATSTTGPSASTTSPT